MAGYQPLYISKNETGLVQSRQKFILPNDAYPVLENAIVWREQIRRKQGISCIVAGDPDSSRLGRALTLASFGTLTAAGAGTFTFNIITGLIGAGSITAAETTAQIQPGDVSNISIALSNGQTLTDTTGTGTLTITGAGVVTAASISYSQGLLILTVSGPLAVTATYTGYYYPSLPVMGLRREETPNSAFDTTVAFDTVYAYTYNGATNTWMEFLPGTTWTGTNFQFFWTTNYFVGTGNLKIFWATNNNDPIRYTTGAGGSNWVNFAPQTNAGGGTLNNALALLPFRGRLLAFNTTEDGSGGGIFTNRIRWSAIGTPFTVTSPIVSVVNVNSWRDDIRGQGGFLNVPTSEDITAVGFVRDNLVVYCERSTWQLRYTGRAIAPFQIERVNSELGAESLFSAVQFDTSLVAIGDRGIVECDSYKSERIDVKIPDLVYGGSSGLNGISSRNQGITRVQGVRDYISKMAYWTYSSVDRGATGGFGIFPDKVVAYNYENDSWAIYDNAFTCFGNFQTTYDRTWVTVDLPWVDCDFAWITEPFADEVVIAGNQEGFVMQLANQLQALVNNDTNLSISNVIGYGVTQPTQIVVFNHNLPDDTVIEIADIVPGTPFANLNTGINPNTGLPFNANNGIFSITVADPNTLNLFIYNPNDGQFSTPELDAPNTGYIGPGYISVLDNFNVTSKKFNFLEEGQSIQMGYLDILMSSTTEGAISLNVYIDYDDDNATNTLPANIIDTGTTVQNPDTFFNATIPTTQGQIGNVVGTKYWQRVFCPTRGNFLTLQYTLSNAQMAGIEQTMDVQIDAQILWIRKAGRLTAP